MKKSTIVIGLCLGLWFFQSCQKDDKTVLNKVEASQLEALPVQEYRLTEQEVGDKVAFTATWTETYFYLDRSEAPTPASPVQYLLQADRAGSDFANAQTLAVTTELRANIYVNALNTALVEGLGVVADEPVDIDLRLIAAYGQHQVQHVPSANTLRITVTPFAATQGIKQIYLLGDMNGWDNRNTDFMMFRDNSDPKNQTYTYVGRIQGNCYFKFLPAESLGSYKAYSRKDEQHIAYVESDEGAFYNEKEGYKRLTINLQDMTYHIEDYDVSNAKTFAKINFVGAFCNWGENNADPVMNVSTYDPHIWKLDITLDVIDYGVKFRANHSWDDRWCPPNPDDLPYGTLDYNPTGHDNNISLQEPGRYSVVFNDLTGHFVILKK